MKASLQQQIAPVTQQGAYEFSDAATKENEKAADSSQPNRTNFRDLITNSMEDVRREREAKDANDFSNIKDEGEFLKRLAESTQEKRVPKNNLDKDDFLTLFVAQLQHQDPLNPDDGAEMASKLAQFNSLEQMMNVNKTLEKMVEGQTRDQSASMINYIGKEVTTQGGKLRINAGKMSETTFSVPLDATQSNLEVRDGNGKVVFFKEIGTLAAGNHTLPWNGKDTTGQNLPDGLYTYNITAKGLNDEKIPIEISGKSKILGVDFKDSEKALYTDVGKIGFGDIVSIGEPGYGKPAAPKVLTTHSATDGKAGKKQQTSAVTTAPARARSTNEELQKLLMEQALQQAQPQATAGSQPLEPEPATNQNNQATEPQIQQSSP